MYFNVNILVNPDDAISRILVSSLISFVSTIFLVIFTLFKKNFVTDVSVID